MREFTSSAAMFEHYHQVRMRLDAREREKEPVFPSRPPTLPEPEKRPEPVEPEPEPVEPEPFHEVPPWVNPVLIMIRASARYFHVQINDITGPRHTPEYVRARRVAMYLAFRLTGLRTKQIAKPFNRERSAVSLAHLAVARDMLKDDQLAADVEAVRRMVVKMRPALRWIT